MGMHPLFIPSEWCKMVRLWHIWCCDCLNQDSMLVLALRPCNTFQSLLPSWIYQKPAHKHREGTTSVTAPTFEAVVILRCLGSGDMPCRLSTCELPCQRLQTLSDLRRHGETFVGYWDADWGCHESSIVIGALQNDLFPSSRLSLFLNPVDFYTPSQPFNGSRQCAVQNVFYPHVYNIKSMM